MTMKPRGLRTMLLVAATAMVGLAGIGAGPALADSRWDHDHWRHERWDHDDWRRNRGYVYVEPSTPYYAPPPVVYAPPPSAPVFSFGFRF